MWDFNKNFVAAFLLVLLSENFLMASTENDLEYEDPPKEPETLFNSRGKCVLNVNALQYEINIDPIILPRYVNGYQGVSNIFAAAWVKINVAVKDSVCNGSEDTVIKLKQHNCIIASEKVQVTLHGNKLPVAIKAQTIYKKYLQSWDYFPAPYLYTIQLVGSFKSGDQLEVYIPYDLKLDHNDQDSLQGLYVFDTPKLSPNISERDASYFYPVRAKHMFPEIDQNQPQKSRFKISVARSETDGLVVISNTNVERSANIIGMDGWIRDQFRKTLLLPVDQVTVMILGGFQKHTYHHESTNPRLSNITINIWTKNKTKLAKNGDEENLVKEISVEVFRLVDIFGSKFSHVGYPFTKLDIILECQTQGQSSLGVINLHPDYRQLLMFEMARQWIGGMVTPYSENNDWEAQRNIPGLAYYVAEWGAKSYLDIWDISSRTGTLDDWECLRMLEGIFSREVMEFAVAQIYLPKMKWKMVLTDYIYDAIQEAVVIHNATHLLPTPETTVKDINKMWLKDKVINKITVTDTSNDTTFLHIILQRDYLKENMSWVPLKVYMETGTEVIWLPAPQKNISTTETTFTTTTNTKSKWVVVGSVFTDCFRVRHNGSLFGNIMQQLKTDHTVIPWHLRKCLLSSYFYMRDSWDDMIQFLELTKYLGNETNLRVWMEAINDYGDLHRIIRQRPDGERLSKSYFAGLVNSVLEKIGAAPVAGESKESSRLRIKLLTICATFEAPLCLCYSKQLTTTWMRQTEISPFTFKNISSIRTSIICAALRDSSSENDNSQLFNFLLDKLTSLKNDTVDEIRGPGYESDLLYSQISWMARALACSNNDSFLLQLLSDDTLDKIPESVREYYIRTVAPEIGRQRPYTMTDTLLDFWKRKQQDGVIEADSFTEYWNDLVASGSSPEGVMEKVNKFLDENKNLFSGDLEAGIAYFKESMFPYHAYMEEFEKHDYNKIVGWLRQNI